MLARIESVKVKNSREGVNPNALMFKENDLNCFAYIILNEH